MADRPVMLGQNTRQREERERVTPDSIPVIKAVTNVTNSNVTLWTVTTDPDKFLYIEDFGVCNISGVAIKITVYIVPSGGAALATNKVYDGFQVLAGDSGTLTAVVGHTLNPGDLIIAATDNATGANFWLWGQEFTGGVPTRGSD